jgi:hypothetical protein
MYHALTVHQFSAVDLCIAIISLVLLEILHFPLTPIVP